MSQIFLINENIAPLVKASGTTITMAATYLGKDTRVSVGGRQYRASTTITLNTAAANGINALDTGSLAANTLYYLYAVQQAGVLGLVASTAAPTTGPAGFGAWKEIGRFRTFFGSAAVAVVTNRIIGNNIKYTFEFNRQLYTSNPAVNQGLGDVTGTNLTYTNLNNSIAIEGSFTVGTPTAVQARLALPSGYSVATPVSASTNCGHFWRNSATATQVKKGVTLAAAGEGYLKFSFDDYTTASNPLVAQIGTAVFASATAYGIMASIPIAEYVGLFD